MEASAPGGVVGPGALVVGVGCGGIKEAVCRGGIAPGVSPPGVSLTRWRLPRAGGSLAAALWALIFVNSCAHRPCAPLAYRLDSVQELAGWEADALEAALPGLRSSCQLLLSEDSLLRAASFGSSGTRWRRSCSELMANDDLRAVLERDFVALTLRHSPGLITGYYTPIAAVTRAASSDSAVAAYARPDDLLDLDLGLFDPKLAGQRTAARRVGRQLLPYYDRAAIEEGALAGRGLELLWFPDPVDLYFLQVQGSGRVVFADGTQSQLSFAGSNGRPYFSLGRLLADRGDLPKSERSAQGVAAWLHRHGDQARAVMQRNPRYIFFAQGAVTAVRGALGIPLTAGRSLAVDPRFFPLGLPLWLETRGSRDHQPLARLVVAADRGAAIIGPQRGDLYWGVGAPALARAGSFVETGRVHMLLPRDLARDLRRRKVRFGDVGLGCR